MNTRHTFPTDDSRLRDQLSATIEALIALLDTIEGEADREPSLGAPEKTPRPGWHIGGEGADQTHWTEGGTDEREADDSDDEEGGDCEPSLGSLDNVRQLGWARGRNDDGEPSNGAAESLNQSAWSQGNTNDGEPYIAGSHHDLEYDDGYYEGPGFIEGGQGL